jgi:hypothetical protein
LLVKAGEVGGWVGEFTGHHVITSNSEGNLQTGLFTFRNISNNFGAHISPVPSEITTFLEQDTVRCKMAMDKKCLQPLKDFK